MTDTKDRRLRERLRLAIPVRVRFRESVEFEWTEVTRCVDVTPFGASFGLSRPTEPGRLMHLTLPMPRQFRCFDHHEDQYRVWALVRSAKWGGGAEATGAATDTLIVGVALIGKHPPASYLQNPALRYEAAERGGALVPLVAQSALNSDRETRMRLPVEVVVEIVGEKGEVIAREETVTENLSRRGAAIYTTLPIGPGRFVRLTSAREQLTIHAVVRARSEGAGGVARLHLEFVNRDWPLE
ncbi:MAG: PilZ domain-containing protein [Pyrinomonadaceae bacterium]